MSKLTATFRKAPPGWEFAIYRDGVMVRQAWCAGSQYDAATAADYEIRLLKGEIEELAEHDLGGEG